MAEYIKISDYNAENKDKDSFFSDVKNTMKYGPVDIDPQAMVASVAGQKLAIRPSAHGVVYDSLFNLADINDIAANGSEFKTAMGGCCIWGVRSCVFRFAKKVDKGKGASRYLFRQKDRKDILKRLSQNDALEQVLVLKHAIYDYHRKLIFWQRSVIQTNNIEKIYYSVPLDEYLYSMQGIFTLLPTNIANKLKHTIVQHAIEVKEYVTQHIGCEVEFVQPMQNGRVTSDMESYVWPYENLKFDIGLEDLGEARIPLSVLKNGHKLPPIFFAALDMPHPNYEVKMEPLEAYNILHP